MKLHRMEESNNNKTCWNDGANKDGERSMRQFMALT